LFFPSNLVFVPLSLHGPQVFQQAVSVIWDPAQILLPVIVDVLEPRLKVRELLPNFFRIDLIRSRPRLQPAIEIVDISPTLFPLTLQDAPPENLVTVVTKVVMSACVRCKANSTLTEV